MKTSPTSVRPPILLDFYDTLVCLDQDVLRTWQLLSALGYPSAPEVEAVWSPDAFDGCDTPAGKDYPEWHRWLLSEHARACGVPATLLVKVVDRLMSNDRAWSVRATTQARRFVQMLKAEKSPVVICTNWDYPLDPYLRQAGLPLSVPAITSWEVGARKPNPRIFLGALERLGLDRSGQRPVVVGDDFDCDMVGALRLGFQAVWVTKSGTHPLVETGQVIRAGSLNEVLTLV
jgi:HAD superfamily hydrolase (TIGR01549 family)